VLALILGFARPASGGARQIEAMAAQAATRNQALGVTGRRITKLL